MVSTRHASKYCPVGARKFGNLLDPESEIRYILANKRVLVLKSRNSTPNQDFYISSGL